MNYTKKIAAGIVLTSLLASGQRRSKLDKELEETQSPDATVNVIVQYKQQAQERHVAAVTRRGGRHRANLPGMNGAAYSVSKRELAELANDPDVERIVPDRELGGTTDTVLASVNHYPVIDYLNAMRAGKGSGIGIAYPDSGVALNHPDFGDYRQPTVSRIVCSQSFVDSNPSDLHGHGTHVIGIASGMDSVNESLNTIRAFWGVAPDAKIISLKVLDASGKGTDSAVIAAIDRAIQLKNAYNIRVMNLSLGRPVFESYKTDPLCQAVERAWRAGIVVVVSAGNEGRNNSKGNKGYGTISSPGNDPFVITVGAVNHKSDWDRANDAIATYS